MDNASWYRAYCPICGGEPDFAALEKETGARRLLCSRCDFEWLFHRSICPFCGEDGIDKLGYYSSDDGVYRLYNCERCGRYLKTVDLRDLVRPVDLPAERVLTIGMDVAAMEVSYRGRLESAKHTLSNEIEDGACRSVFSIFHFCVFSPGVLTLKRKLHTMPA